MNPKKRGLGFLAAAAGSLAAAIGILLAGWLPSRARERMAENERAASVALLRIGTAEADFRANDRDGNGIQDFWVGDVGGLFLHGALPDRSIAEADARPLKALVPRPIPRSGYLFVAMQSDEGDGAGTFESYAQDTDGTGRKVHNTSKFGFCAYPAVYGETGRNTFFINEGNTIGKLDMGGAPLLRWPFDSTLKLDWEKMD